MAQCSSSDLIVQACQSGFSCRSEPELLALLNQLLCNLNNGITLTAPDGSRWRLVVANDGTLSTEAVA